MADIDEFDTVMRTSDTRVLHLAMHNDYSGDRSESTSVFMFTKISSGGEELIDGIPAAELATKIGAHVRRGCLECVVISTCKGNALASLLLAEGIAFVVAWSTDVDDKAGCVTCIRHRRLRSVHFLLTSIAHSFLHRTNPKQPGLYLRRRSTAVCNSNRPTSALHFRQQWLRSATRTTRWSIPPTQSSCGVMGGCGASQT